MADGQESFEEKTEQATTQRREDFRKAGQVAQSREINNILILVGVGIVFYFLSREFLTQIMGLFSVSFTDNLVKAARQGEIIPAVKLALEKGFYIVAPVFGITALMAIGATVAQIGFLTAWDHISPDIERINPVSGLTKILNMRSLIEGLKSVAKITVIATVAFLVVKDELAFTPQVVQLSVPQIFSYMGHVIFKLIGGVCALMACVAVLDYAFQRWDLERRMRMTKQEVKEEFKQRGDGNNHHHQNADQGDGDHHVGIFGKTIEAFQKLI